MSKEKESHKSMEQDSYSEFEPSSNEGGFQDGMENGRSKMIWSEIGHIVHSNRKPQYSLSSILRRTNLFDEQDLNQDEEAGNDDANAEDVFEGVMETDEMGDSGGGARKSKALELLQVTDIIKNVHKEEVKIYLDEIAVLRSHILQISKSQARENDLLFEERGVSTSMELSSEVLMPVHILPGRENHNRLGSDMVSRVEIPPDALPEKPESNTTENELLKEKNDYIQKLEDLNIEIQRQLDVRNEQFSSISLELVRQKSLLNRESENLRKSQQSESEMRRQLKQLIEKVSENEKYYMEQQEQFRSEENSLKDAIQGLESEKRALSRFLEDLLKLSRRHQIESESTQEWSYLDILKSYSRDSPVWKSYSDLLELIFVIDQTLQSLKKKKTSLVNSETQTNIIQNLIKTKKPKIGTERVSSIFIQSISNFQNYYENNIPIASSYISENMYKKDVLFKANSERNPDFISNISATRFRNEINVLKNQLDAAKQKLKLKDLENKKLSEEISYLKNKIIRNKAYNSSLSSQNFDCGHSENYKLINNLKLNKLSRSKNYYTSSSHDKLSDENWDEIFSVIQQLKGP